MERAPDAVFVDGLGLAKDAGSVRSINVVLLGALSCHLDFSHDEWRRAIETRVPKKTIDVNLTAFELGRRSAQG
jgi:indolepyruvate ferredoxin oxidoreductase beta subunit